MGLGLEVQPKNIIKIHEFIDQLCVEPAVDTS